MVGVEQCDGDRLWLQQEPQVCFRSESEQRLDESPFHRSKFMLGDPVRDQSRRHQDEH